MSEHTEDQPYCEKTACWCHYLADYHTYILKAVLEKEPSQEEYIERVRSFTEYDETYGGLYHLTSF
jgi:hypothetical protein